MWRFRRTVACCSGWSEGRQTQVVHNIGRWVEESPLAEFFAQRAAGHYRWPVIATQS